MIPPLALEDSEGKEIARIWAAQGAQHVSLRIGQWPDPGAWGIMLVDLAKHVANAYEQDNGTDRAKVLARIRELFDAEWKKPTDEPKGKVQK